MADIRQFRKRDHKGNTLPRINKLRDTEEEKSDITEEQEGEKIADYKKKRWLHKGKKLGDALLILAVALVLIGIYRFYQKERIYTDYDVLTLTELSEPGSMTYMEYGDYIIRYSMDGISCIDKNGSLIWGQAYEIKIPIIDICKDYVAVASQKGNVIYLFDKTGSQGSVTTEYPITSISVASQGVVAAVMEEGGKNYVKIYDKAGELLVSLETSLEGNGYPLDVDLSEDGRKLVVSSLDIAENEMENSIIFYNFSEVGQNYIEQLVGGYSKAELGDALIPDVEFVDNSTVCAFADNKLILFSMKEIPSLTSIVEIEKEIHSVFYSNQYVGVVLNEGESNFIYQMRVYDFTGKLVLEEPLDQDYKRIGFESGQIVLYNDNSVQIYAMDGTKKFQYTFEKNIILFKQIEEYRYVWINSSSINDIRLK